MESDQVEDGVRVEAVHRGALLHPRPVAEGERAADAQALQRRDPGRRGQEQRVDDQSCGRHQVEGEVGEEGHLRPFRDDEVFVCEAEGPVEGEDEHLEGCGGAVEEAVLPGEEDAAGGDVGGVGRGEGGEDVGEGAEEGG